MNKNGFTLLLLLFTASLFAQVPQGINYQAVARDGDGNLLTDRTLQVDVEFREVGKTKSAYVETHKAITNEYGLFTLVLGQGNPKLNTAFADIDWSKPQEMGITIDRLVLGFTPFQAVPYALATGPREHVIGIPAAVFTPNNNTAEFRSSIGNGGVGIRSVVGTETTTVLNAPVQLPHGAVVTEITAYFIDESEAQLRIWLAKEFYSSAFAIAAEVNTEGQDPAIRSETINPDITIDNTNGGYYLRVFCNDWELPGTKLIKGVQITYTY